MMEGVAASNLKREYDAMPQDKEGQENDTLVQFYLAVIAVVSMALR